MSSSDSSVDGDTPDQASLHSKYRLRVTAGPSYDTSTHELVQVNAPEELTFESEHLIISVAVRIKRFTGFPDSSPETSPYFSHTLHTSDQYSIAFSFIPKVDIPGNDLVFGNDFDRPIKDRLPPGFSQAFNFVKWWIDPGLDGDVYGDKPYLYGPALSSWNILRICDKVVDSPDSAAKEAWKLPNASSFHEMVVEEGAEGTGVEARKEADIPADSALRKKFFLKQSNREAFIFEAGRLYQSDFGNPYLDFNDFSLKLPAFTLNIIKYVDERSHDLRYTLKNIKTGEVYAIVMFNLLFGEELREAEDDAGPGEHANQSTAEEGNKDSHDQKVTATYDEPEPAPSADDLD